MGKKLSTREKIWYGAGDLSGNILFGAVSFYLLYFFIKVMNIPAGFASAIFLVGKLWDAFTDYAMGRICDKTHNKRFGRKRVYMLFGALPYALGFILLWWNPLGADADALAKGIYFLGMYCVFDAFWTMVYIPYNSLTVSMTDDYDERTSLNGYRIVMANIGLILGAAVFSLMCEGEESILYGIFGDSSTAYAVTGLIFGLIAGVIMFLSGYNIKERHEDLPENNKGFFQTLKEFFSLKEFRYITFYYLLSMVGFDIIMSLFMFLIRDSLNFGGGMEAMLFVALPLVIAIGSSFFWVKLSEKYSKHKVYLWAVIEITIALACVALIPAYDGTSVLPYIIAVIVIGSVGFGMSAIQIIPFASLPDVVEVDEYTFGTRREGAYYGINQFLYKVASGVAIAIVGAILELTGYMGDAELAERELLGLSTTQTPEAILAVRLTVAFLPSIIFLVSTIFAYRANLGRERFNLIKQELKDRKTNKEETK